MTRTVSARYQQGVPYDPGRAVGFYPDAALIQPTTPVTVPGAGGAGQIFIPPAVDYAAPAPAPAGLNLPPVQYDTGGGGNSLLGSLAGTALGRVGNYLANSYTGEEEMQRLRDFGGDLSGEAQPALDPATFGADLSGEAAAAPTVNAGVDAGGNLLEGGAELGSGGLSLSGIGDGLRNLGSLGNLANMGAGALGSWAGGRLAREWVDGDPEQQGLASSIGGTLGGIGGGLLGGAAAGAMGIAAGSTMGSIVPGIGTLIGALVGALASGTLGAGSPDYPYTYDNANLNSEGIALGTAGAGNHADPREAGVLGARVSDYIRDRAQREGLQFDPFYTGAGYSVGTMTGPDGGYTFSNTDPFHAYTPASHEYDYTTGSIDDLQQMAYANLVQRGILTGTPTTTQSQVDADMAQQQAAYQDRLARFNAGDQSAGVQQQYGSGEGGSWIEYAAPTAPLGIYSGYAASMGVPAPASGAPWVYDAAAEAAANANLRQDGGGG